MTNTTEEKDRDVTILQIIRAAVSAYGQIAFGLVSILVLWFAVVAPELAQNRTERHTLYQAALAIDSAAAATKEAAASTKEAARIVERIANDMVRELERTRGPR